MVGMVLPRVERPLRGLLGSHLDRNRHYYCYGGIRVKVIEMMMNGVLRIGR